jgi:hypothetical protein
MKLVEQHLMRKDDPRFAVIDQAAFASKNCTIRPHIRFARRSSMKGRTCRMRKSSSASNRWTVIKPFLEKSRIPFSS